MLPRSGGGSQRGRTGYGRTGGVVHKISPCRGANPPRTPIRGLCRSRSRDTPGPGCAPLTGALFRALIRAMIIVEPADPRAPGPLRLLQESHALMQRLFDPEDNHFLSVDALGARGVHFFQARRGTAILGVGALAEKDGYGELKSIFVDEGARGSGIADALMRQLEDQARRLGLPLLRLETGSLLHAAHRLYARHGFTACEPFGDYDASEFSVFMEKPLADARAH